jgi:hypothetical protein
MQFSNAQLYIKSNITSTQGVGTTFLIAPLIETAEDLDTGSETVTVVLKNATQVERMEITAAAGVATIVFRGLTESETQTADVLYQKSWGDGSLIYTSPLAFNLVDKRYAKPLRFKVPTVADDTARAALYPAPTGGEKVMNVANGGKEEVYNATTAQWEAAGTSTAPGNASTVAAGLVEIATQVEVDAGTDTGGTGAMVALSPSTYLAGFIPKLISLGVALPLGTGVDGDLVVSSGTTNLTLGQVYNYSSISISVGATLSSAGTGSPMILKCLGTANIAGTIDLSGKNIPSSSLESKITGKQYARGDSGNGGTGGHGGGGSSNGGGGAGSSQGEGCGGGGGGGGASTNSGIYGGAGGGGGIFGGVGGASVYGSGKGGDSYSNNGGTATGLTGSSANGNPGGTSSGGSGSISNNQSEGSCGGGGAGGKVGNSGGALFLYCNAFSGSGTINASALNGGNGGNGGNGFNTGYYNTSSVGGGGGAGGGGGGGIIVLGSISGSFGGSKFVSAGTAGTLGAKGTTGYQINATDGGSGTSGSVGVTDSVSLTAYY